MKLQQEATVPLSACWGIEVHLFCLLCVICWVNAQFYAKWIAGIKKNKKKNQQRWVLWQSASISPHIHTQWISQSSCPLFSSSTSILLLHCVTFLIDPPLLWSASKISGDRGIHKEGDIWGQRCHWAVELLAAWKCWSKSTSSVAVLMVNFHFLYVFPRRGPRIQLLLFPRCFCSALMYNPAVQGPESMRFLLYSFLPFNKKF